MNLKKTQVVVFRNGGVVKRLEKWYYKGNKLDVVSCYRFLGINFSSRGIWFKAQQTLADQANKALYSVKRNLTRFGEVPLNIWLKIFETKIVPILTYGSEIWGFHPAKQVETVHNKFCKYILKMYSTSNNVAARSELGRLPMKVVLQTKIIRYWLKLTTMPEKRIAKQCYNKQCIDAERGVVGWACNVKNMLQSMGLNDVWLAQGVGNQELFLAVFKQRCNDIALQREREEISDSSKLELLSQIKLEPGFELYLSVIDKPMFRIALSRFRCSNHDLMIEKGRALGIPREERLCPLCIIPTIESEYHFMLICEFYKEMRSRFLPEYFIEKPSIQKLYLLFNTSSAFVLNNLARYIYFAMKLRTERLSPRMEG